MKQLDGAWSGKTTRAMRLMFLIRGRLLLTHYCSAGNQPRMQASASRDDKTVTFDFVDATNLASQDAGHMTRVVFTFVDTNHHTEEWQFKDHGKEIVERFDLQKKS